MNRQEALAHAEDCVKEYNGTYYAVESEDGKFFVRSEKYVTAVHPKGQHDAVPLYDRQSFPSAHALAKELLTDNEIVYSAQRVDGGGFDLFCGKRPRLEDGYRAIYTHSNRSNTATIERADVDPAATMRDTMKDELLSDAPEASTPMPKVKSPRIADVLEQDRTAAMRDTLGPIGRALAGDLGKLIEKALGEDDVHPDPEPFDDDGQVGYGIAEILESERAKDTPHTIDLTPSWVTIMPVLLDAIMKNDDDSANEAMEVLIDLAERVDATVDSF